MIFHYITVKTMEPRPGTKYSTKYFKMRRPDRNLLRDHVIQCCRELLSAWDTNSESEREAHMPLSGFKRLNQANRSLYEIVVELLQEATASKRDGSPKDFAVAPIDRWNRMFMQTEYEIQMQLKIPLKSPLFMKILEELA